MGATGMGMVQFNLQSEFRCFPANLLERQQIAHIWLNWWILAVLQIGKNSLGDLLKFPRRPEAMETILEKVAGHSSHTLHLFMVENVPVGRVGHITTQILCD